MLFVVFTAALQGAQAQIQPAQELKFSPHGFDMFDRQSLLSGKRHGFDMFDRQFLLSGKRVVPMPMYFICLLFGVTVISVSLAIIDGVVVSPKRSWKTACDTLRHRFAHAMAIDASQLALVTAKGCVLAKASTPENIVVLTLSVTENDDAMTICGTTMSGTQAFVHLGCHAPEICEALGLSECLDGFADAKTKPWQWTRVLSRNTAAWRQVLLLVAAASRWL